MDRETELHIRRRLLDDFDLSQEGWDPELIGMVETDLIDEYLRGELSGGELRQFESRYLERPENRRKVEVAAAFQRWTQSPPKPRFVGIRQVGLVAAMMLAIVVYWQLSTVTLYPGAVRESGGSEVVVHRFLPRRVKIALIDQAALGSSQIVLRNPEGEVWKTAAQIPVAAEYVVVLFPIWKIPAGSYSLELQTLSNRQFRTVASYRISFD